jgi:hypothetical protein
MLYEVQTRFVHGWENCWTDDDGNLVTFNSFYEAANAVAEHIQDQRDAVANGDMDEEYDINDFRIVLSSKETV